MIVELGWKQHKGFCMKINARELKEEGKTNHKQQTTWTICLPEFGFQMKPMFPLRCP